MSWMKDIFVGGGWQLIGEDKTIITLCKGEDLSVTILKAEPETISLKHVAEEEDLTYFPTNCLARKDMKSQRYKLWDQRLVRSDELKRQLYKLVQNPKDFIEQLSKKN
jgi:hypothetical protein